VRGPLVIYSVMAMVMVSVLGAVGIMCFAKSSPFADRLFDTFLSLIIAGFYALLELLRGRGRP
jgi:hypothetical protein